MQPGRSAMQPNFHERRSDPRRRSLLGAALRIAPEMSSSECVVRDIGPGGARLLISDTVPLTETFELVIGPRRESRRVRLTWRRAGAVGVSFVRPQPAAVPVPLDLMRALRTTRADNDALRRRVADLERRLDDSRS